MRNLFFAVDIFRKKAGSQSFMPPFPRSQSRYDGVHNMVREGRDTGRGEKEMEEGGQKGRKPTSGKLTEVERKKGSKRAREANSRGTQQRDPAEG